jgi:hypothetical protein
MKIKHYTFFSDSHKIFLKYFLNSFPFDSSVDLIIRYIPQECKSAEYESEGFDKSMKKKVKFINDAFGELKNDDILIFTDPDVFFVKPYKNLFLKEMGDSDIIFQSDVGTACMGIFCCKVSDKTKFFFKDLYENLDNFKHDQEAANALLTTKNYNLNIKLFSHKIFNYGFNGVRYEGEDTIKIPNDIVLLHANFAVGIEKKIKLIKLTMNQFKKNI